MKRVTSSLSDDEIEWLAELEAELGATRAEALRRLIRRGLTAWRRERALDRLEAGSITLRRAADLAGVGYVDMLSLASSAGIEVGYTRDDLDRDLER